MNNIKHKRKLQKAMKMMCNIPKKKYTNGKRGSITGEFNGRPLRRDWYFIRSSPLSHWIQVYNVRTRIERVSHPAYLLVMPKTIGQKFFPTISNDESKFFLLSWGIVCLVFIGCLLRASHFQILIFSSYGRRRDDTTKKNEFFVICVTFYKYFCHKTLVLRPTSILVLQFSKGYY